MAIGVPLYRWMFLRKFHLEMDDDWGYPHDFGNHHTSRPCNAAHKLQLGMGHFGDCMFQIESSYLTLRLALPVVTPPINH